MTHTPTPQTEPTSAIAGDTWRWERVLSDHAPSDGWALSYAFVGPSWLKVTAQPDGDKYVITVPAADTEKLEPGNYRWSAYVTKDPERFTIGEGRLLVRPNLTRTDPAKSHAERMVGLLETAIEEKITLGSTSIEINGRQANLIPTQELRQLLGHYRSELRRSRHPKKLGARVEVHFGSS